MLLTIQVDSIAKYHENDTVIPANVEEAVNFYQPHGWLHGQSQIRAADPERTEDPGKFPLRLQQAAGALLRRVPLVGPPYRDGAH